MKTSFSAVPTFLVALLASTTAFHIVKKPYRGRAFTVRLSIEDEPHITVNPMEEGTYHPVDMERAKECAEHFGKCSVEEIQELKDGLHKQRMAWDDSFDDRVLEEELDLQLSMLKEKQPDPELFPEVEAPMEELPHLKDHTLSEKLEDAVHRAEVELAMEETVLEEGNLEALAICAVIGALVLIPMLHS